jgi:hypothetical protein
MMTKVTGEGAKETNYMVTFLMKESKTKMSYRFQAFVLPVKKQDYDKIRKSKKMKGEQTTCKMPHEDAMFWT